MSDRLQNMRGDKGSVTIAPDGSVHLDPASHFAEDPKQDSCKYTFQLATARVIGGDNGTVVRDMAVKYDDGGVCLLASIPGCVVEYRKTTGKAQTKSRGADHYKTEYGVTTVCLGIPEARYAKIAQLVSEVKSGAIMSINAEKRASDHVWIDCSIQHDPSVLSSSPEYEDRNDTQVVYADIDENGEPSIMTAGSIRSILLTVAMSIKVVAYVALRLKSDVKSAKKNCFRLGGTIHCVQLMDFSDLGSPDLAPKIGSGSFNKAILTAPALVRVARENKEAEVDAEEVSSADEEDSPEQAVPKTKKEQKHGASH